MMRYSLVSRRLDEITLWTSGEPIISFAQLERAWGSVAPAFLIVTMAESGVFLDETPLERVNVKVGSAVARGRARRSAKGGFRMMVLRGRMVDWVLVLWETDRGEWTLVEILIEKTVGNGSAQGEIQRTFLRYI